MRYLRDRRETHFQTSRCDSDKGEVRKPAEPISNLKTGVSATELSEVSSMDPASEDSFPSSEINVVDHDTEDNQSEYSDILEDSDVHEDSYADEDCSFNDEDSNAIDEDSDAIDEDSDVIDYDSDAIDEGSDAYDGDNDATVDDAESTNSQISVAYPEGTELLPSHSCGTLQDREIQMEVGECSHSRTLSQHLQQPLSKGSESSSSSPAPTNSCDETDGVENCYELYDPDSIVVEDCCSHPKPRSPKPASRKRPYNEVDAEAEETHTPKCCTNLLTIDIKGWKLLLPQDNEDVRLRNRSELLRLLNEVTAVLEFFNGRKCDKESLEYFHRLACKLRHHLLPHKSNIYRPACSCSVLSESCSGLIRGPPILLEDIHCEYTERVLPPVIFQTFEMEAPWIKIHDEIITKVRGHKVPATVGCIKVVRRPLTFAHITSQHVPAIQCLLGTYFWSNVDVSTVLQYPEFTCVVLYGKLVVGFGYLSPGAHRNEGYINFIFVRPHWRRCGIGETILYLLRQQCLFWTLTLHVSPNSEALNLYHKFGFKTYCRIKNFYVGYVISNSQSEKDALFMKLESRIPQMF